MSTRRILAALLLLTLFAGCQKKEGGSVSIKPRNSYLDASAGSVFVEVKATLAWTITLEYPAGTEAWAGIEPESGEGSKSDIRLRYQANADAVPRTVTLVLNGQGASARAEVTQDGTGGGIEGQYGYDVAPPSLRWLELPAMEAGDGRELLVHNMEGGKYRGQAKGDRRNWSCYWDYKEHMSLWVAYPHNKALIGSGKRTDEWGVYDPCIPAAIQPNMKFTYGGGWTRGHQIPSADRYTRAANISTFYPTNMTPQNYDFNTKIWADLEGKVRNYAANVIDTLYVVTGALFDDAVSYSGSNTGFSVKIPTHYFKAILARTQTYGIDGYLAAGYIFPHKSEIAKGNYLDYICSIDELEQQTGIDFFPNLIREIGQEKADKVEAEKPGNWWK